MPNTQSGWRAIALSGLISAMVAGGGATLVVGEGKADKEDVEKLEVKVDKVIDNQVEIGKELAKVKIRQENIKEDTEDTRDDVKEILRRLPH